MHTLPDATLSFSPSYCSEREGRRERKRECVRKRKREKERE
jgi:hypothetical protein